MLTEINEITRDIFLSVLLSQGDDNPRKSRRRELNYREFTFALRRNSFSQHRRRSATKWRTFGNIFFGDANRPTQISRAEAVNRSASTLQIRAQIKRADAKSPSRFLKEKLWRARRKSN